MSKKLKTVMVGLGLVLLLGVLGVGAVAAAIAGVRPHFVARALNLETSLPESLPLVDADSERVG